jgi:MerR family transcriptional regulator, light-induced transcriptional regulator
MPDELTHRHLHPISVVAERTGLSPDLLRIWERRYNVVEPARDDGGRRLYSDSDIERLRLLAQATSAGRSIGQLLELDTAELSELVRADEAARWRAPRPSAEDGEFDDAEAGFVVRGLAHTKALDAAALEAELLRAAATVGAARFMDRVIAPLFRLIGDAWHAGEISIAQEHMASGVAHPVMARVRGALPVGADAPGVVVAMPAGERHEIGAMLAAGAAALEGWRVTYLGADLPAAEIAAAARETGARMVALSSVYADPESLAHELRALRDALPSDVDVVVGGQGVTTLNGAADIAGVATLPDLAALRKRLSRR